MTSCMCASAARTAKTAPWRVCACGRPCRARRSALTGEITRALNLYDVVYVRVGGSNSKNGAVARLRVRPTVQGAALVLENKTGRILAMAGSFSYPLSQLKRTSQTQRQPGSAIKPLTYLTALHKGPHPNPLIPDEPLTLPPIG